jgi:hypothetical protein
MVQATVANFIKLFWPIFRSQRGVNYAEKSFIKLATGANTIITFYLTQTPSKKSVWL